MVAQVDSASIVNVSKPRYRFRGPYKKHPKPISPYKSNAQVCEKLASYYIFWNQKDETIKAKDLVIDFWGLRIWQRVYPHERIKGKFRYIQEAEIIGSENLNIYDRLLLHSVLLMLLENNVGLYEAMAHIRQEMKRLEKPQIGDFALWLKKIKEQKPRHG